MQFEDHGVILSSQKFQESSVIITILTENHGLVKGLFRASRKNKADIVTGNVIEVTWKARLTEHLGKLTIENAKSILSIVAASSKKIAVVNSALAMCQCILQELEPQKKVYDQLMKLFSALDKEQDVDKEYLILELELLKKSGYGLDLTKCVVTHGRDNLIYISPKSGCAVCSSAGEQYKDKLFKLPTFLKDYNLTPDNDDIVEAGKILSHFFNKFYFLPFNKKVPAARNKLISTLTAI
jgi:DNA repair protein RecO (recombination protein O)